MKLKSLKSPTSTPLNTLDTALKVATLLLTLAYGAMLDGQIAHDDTIAGLAAVAAWGYGLWSGLLGLLAVLVLRSQSYMALASNDQDGAVNLLALRVHARAIGLDKVLTLITGVLMLFVGLVVPAVLLVGTAVAVHLMVEHNASQAEALLKDKFGHDARVEPLERR